MARFGFRQIGRDGLRSLLTTLVALGLVLALGWIQWNMDKNRAEVDHLYGTTVVEAEIVKANSSLVTNAGGFIAQGTVDQILASGFIRSAYTEAAAQVLQVMPVADPETPQDVGYYILAFDQPENFFATLSTRDTVQYAAGVDESLFTQNWDVNSLRRNGVTAVFPETILDQFGLKIGDQVYLSEESGTTYPYHVVGQYTPGVRQYSASIVGSIGDPILLPLSALKAIQGDNLYYSTVKFVIDPAKNRDLPAFEEETTRMVSKQGAGRLPLKIHFWDEELRSVVEPLEKNFSLLEVLYPVTVAVSALIGAGLCLLLILQQARDTALLRTLGVGKTSVRAVLCSEQILLSLAGVLLGLGLLGGLRQNLPAVLGRPAFLAAGSYLLGALIGSLIGAISISNKKPLDLLQVKE
ncbi:MAG: hypothetical protein IMZ62_08675 [Chloroflexi bacterium]|nr:hypothetical protein [Chloroflexota bacterium]